MTISNSVKVQLPKIYVVIDPVSHIVQYVGKTTYSITDRMREHKSKGGVLTLYLKDLDLIGLKPVVIFVEICTEENWQQCEKNWIAFYREINPSLLNIADGGIGASGTHWNDNVKQQMLERYQKKVFVKSINTGDVMEFESRSHVAEHFGITNAAVTYAIQRRNKTNGCLFSDTPTFEQTYASSKYRKAIVCTYPDGSTKQFDCIRSAAIELTLDNSMISKVVNGAFKTYKGYRFAYPPTTL